MQSCWCNAKAVVVDMWKIMSMVVNYFLKASHLDPDCFIAPIWSLSFVQIQKKVIIRLLGLENIISKLIEK